MLTRQLIPISYFHAPGYQVCEEAKPADRVYSLVKLVLFLVDLMKHARPDVNILPQRCDPGNGAANLQGRANFTESNIFRHLHLKFAVYVDILT